MKWDWITKEKIQRKVTVLAREFNNVTDIKKTEVDKFTKAVDDLIEASLFENYGEMMLRRYNQAEAERIAKEIDKEIMDLGDVYVNIKVRKVDLPDDLVRFVNNGVEVVEELKKCRKELEKCRKEIAYLRYKTEKLEGDLEYYKNSGCFLQCPVITYSYTDFKPFINDDVNTAAAEDIFKK